MALLIITGATGLIGSRVTETALRQGHDVLALGRREPPVSGPRFSHADWSLGERLPEAAAAQIRKHAGPACLIHLAHEWRPLSPESEDENLSATKTLIGSVRSIPETTVVLASSISARPDALNRYGRIKWRIEKLADNTMVCAARIGLVYGGPPTGLWGTLERLASISPVIPMVEKHSPVQPIHLDDLCRAFIELACKKSFDRSIFALGAPSPVSFACFLKSIAIYRHRKRLSVVNLPLWIALTCAVILELLPFRTDFNRERIYGLAGLRAIECQDDLKALGLELRDLPAGLAEDRAANEYRPLIEEAICLLTYVKGSRPNQGEIRRYVRGVHAHDGHRALGLPIAALRFPFLLRLVEPLSKQPSTAAPSLSSRLHIALLVLEASSWGGRAIYRYEGRSAVTAITILAVTGLVEACLLPLRYFLGRRRP